MTTGLGIQVGLGFKGPELPNFLCAGVKKASGLKDRLCVRVFALRVLRFRVYRAWGGGFRV